MGFHLCWLYTSVWEHECVYSTECTTDLRLCMRLTISKCQSKEQQWEVTWKLHQFLFSLLVYSLLTQHSFPDVGWWILNVSHSLRGRKGQQAGSNFWCADSPSFFHFSSSPGYVGLSLGYFVSVVSVKPTFMFSWYLLYLCFLLTAVPVCTMHS